MAAATAPLLRSVAPMAPQASAKPASPVSSASRVRAGNAMSRHMGGMLPPGVQAQMQVSNASDPAEKEADATARSVMRMEAPVERAAPSSPRVQRSALSIVQRKPAGPGKAEPDVEADIRASLGGGIALPPGVRKFMEPRFKADFSGVRVHTDGKAAGLAARLSARAFAFGKNVFFGRGEFRPDTPAGKELIAHELTHTIQQRAVVQKQEAPAITQSAPPQIQRFGLDTVLDYIADKANIIPGFRLFTIVIGVNPINMAAVAPTPANILRAAIEFIPGGGLVTQALDNSGVFEKVANWAAQQLKALAALGGSIIQALKAFIKSLGVTDFARPGATWDRAKSIFTGPVQQVKSTVAGWITDIIKFVKEAILKPIGKLAEGTPAYPLLKALLGTDPVTGAPAPFDGNAVVGGLMELAGQQEIWGNVKKANAISRVVSWFQGAKGKLVGFVKQIPSLVVAAFKSLQLSDIILVPLAFIKIGKVFGGFVGDFVSWALEAGWKLLEIVFDVVSPGAWGYVQRTGAALKSILKNPLPFVGNLAKAAKLGFQNFAGRFGEHLKKGLIDWLTGSLSGVYIPKALSLGEIVKFAFSVLGLTWANLRGKLVKAVGETAVAALEKGFEIVKTLVTKGPAAAWEQIKDELAAQKDKVIEGIRNMVIEAVVTKAIPKLVAMFIPGAGFLSAIISIYDLVMVFVQKISKIIAVVTAFIDSIVAIAAGNIGAAAGKVESILAGLLSLAINFLAGFAGLGKIASKINGIIQKIRAPIEKALDSLAAWIKKQAAKFLDKLKKAAKKLLNWWKKKVAVNAPGEKHTLTFSGSGKSAKLVLQSTPQLPSAFLTAAADTRPSVKGDKRTAPIATAVTQEKAIAVVQGKLAAYDDNNNPAASGADEKKAEADMKDLDGKLGTLGTHIVTTLSGWGVADGKVVRFAIPRGSFTVEQKRKIAAQHPDKKELKLNSQGELINLATRDGKALARRHVVSSYDMSQHYSSALENKPWSEAKLLLEQRGSIALSHTPVTGTLGQDAIRDAALRRYGAFFGYAKNLFIGDSAENSSIQELLDRGHPDLAGQKLFEHISRIKRSWAIDSSITISGLTTS